MLPQSYPNYKKVHRRFQPWCENDESECRIDATFASANGGGDDI
jgi:hypothetical protein